MQLQGLVASTVAVQLVATGGVVAKRQPGVATGGVCLVDLVDSRVRWGQQWLAQMPRCLEKQLDGWKSVTSTKFLESVGHIGINRTDLH